MGSPLKLEKPSLEATFNQETSMLSKKWAKTPIKLNYKMNWTLKECPVGFIFRSRELKAKSLSSLKASQKVQVSITMGWRSAVDKNSTIINGKEVALKYFITNMKKKI